MASLALRRFVDLREGEARPVTLSALLLSLLIAGHTVLETARDAMFLEKLPAERLPWVYGALALLSLVAGAASTSFARRFGRRAALVFTLLACAYVITLIQLRPVTPAVVFGLYLTSGVIGTVLLLQFWMFAGQLFTVSQGKRLFGPIGAGGVLGAALGASMAAVALRFFPTSSLLLVGAGLFVASAGVVVRMPTPDDADEAKPPVAGPPLALTKGLGALRKNRYVALVALLTGLGTATVLVADYLFKSMAVEALPRAQLGSFFAVFYAFQNGLALVVQLFVTGAAVRRLGVTGALLVLPLLLVASGATAALGGGFFVALAAKGADGSLRHSLHRVTSELLLLPLPSEIRDRAKPVFDTVFGRGVQAAAAGVILALAAMGWASPRVLGAAMGVLAVGWVTAAIMVRRPYVDLFRRALSLGQLDASDAGAELDLASVEALMEGLSSRDEERVLAAIDVLADSQRARLVPALILYHDAPRVLVRALAVVATRDRRDWIPLGERLLGHTDPGVRAAAVRALAAAGVADIAERALSDASLSVRIAAAYFLATADDPTHDERIADILARDGEDGVEARRSLLALVAEHGSPRFASVVDRILARDGQGPDVPALAAPAVERTRAVRHVPYLVARIDARGARRPVHDALVALGEEGYLAATAALSDAETPVRIRRELPRVVAGFPTQDAVDFLAAHLGREPSGAVRYKVLRALGRLAKGARGPAKGRLRFDKPLFERETLRALVEHVRVEGLVVGLARSADGRSLAGSEVGHVLAGLLADKGAQSLERAFRCLQIVHRHEDIEGVYAALRRGDKRARGNALEFLDALAIGVPEVKELLRLVVDDLPPAERVRRAAALVPTAPADHDATIRLLLQDADELVAALAAYHVLDMGLLALRPEVVAAFEARPALERLGAQPAGGAS